MSETTLITNARMVNEGQITEGDLLIHNGRIKKVASSISAPANTEVVDANGLLLIPGMIDDQVHFREPGLGKKADMHSESRAAVAGGITSFFDMPNTNPQTVTIDALEDKFQLASDRCFANYAFHMGVTNDNIDEIRKLKPEQTCGVKVFMGASTGNMLVDDPKILELLFRDVPTRLSAHCEDTPMILANEEAMRAKYGEDVPIELHPQIRSAEACYKSSSMAVELAKKYDTRLHVLHLTTAKEMSLFEAGNLEDKQITAEACVHHTYFDESRYADKGTLIKCNPAIKTAEDKAALRKAIADNVLDVIATDHAPHLLEEKAGTYFNSPAGLPLVQHALAMALELYHDGVMPLEQVIHKITHAPAKLFGVQERGFLHEGYWADLALVDLNAQHVITRDEILYKCGWSPMEGETLRSRVVKTWVNGNLVYTDGKVRDIVAGKRLEFHKRMIF